MIGPSGNVRVYLACGVTDMRRGIDGLSTMVEAVIKETPGSGAIFGFRGKRADRIKLLWWDGQGLCLFYKILGTRILSLANGERRRCAPDAGAAFDACGRDRLASTGMDVCSRTNGVKAIFCKSIRLKMLALSQQIGYVLGHGNNASGQSERALGTARARR